MGWQTSMGISREKAISEIHAKLSRLSDEQLSKIFNMEGIGEYGYDYEVGASEYSWQKEEDED